MSKYRILWSAWWFGAMLRDRRSRRVLERGKILLCFRGGNETPGNLPAGGRVASLGCPAAGPVGHCWFPYHLQAKGLPK